MQPGFQCSSGLQKKKKTILLYFIANVLGKCLALWAQALKPTFSPGGNVALTTGIPSGTENKGLLFRSIANTESRREMFLKPCGRTTQFSAGLYCQAQVCKQLFFKWYED
jgi:hypothetical protein